MTGPNSVSSSGLSPQSFLSGGVWAFGGRATGTILSVGINALLARLLSPDDLGTYFLAFSLVTALVLVAQVGSKQAMVRLVAAATGRGEGGRARGAARAVMIVGTMGTIAVGVALGGGGAALVSSVFDAPAFASAWVPLALWVAVVALYELANEGHRAVGDIRAAVLFSWVVGNVVVLVVLGVLFLFGARLDFRAAAWVSVAGGGTALTLACSWLARRFRKWRAEPVPLRSVLGISTPLLVTHLALFVIGQSGLWIMGILRPEEEVALYGAAFRLVTLVKMPLLIVNAVVPPFIAAHYARGETQTLETVLRTASTAAAMPALVVLGMFALSGGSVLGIVYGPAYAEAASILGILSLGQAFVVWSGSADLTLMLTGHQVPMALTTILSGSVGVGGAVWAGARWGGVGVAGASLVAMGLQSFAMVVLARRLVGVRTAASFQLETIRSSFAYLTGGFGWPNGGDGR